MIAPFRSAKARPSERILFGALWLAFAGLIVRAIGAESDPMRNAGRLLIDIGGAGLVVVGIPLIRRVANSSSARRYSAIFVLLFASVVAAATGLLRGNTLLLWVLMGVLPFMSMMAVLAVPQDQAFRERLLQLLIWQTVAGVAFATYVIIFEPIASRAVWNGPNGDGLGKTAARCLYATPFLLAAFARLKPWQAFLAVAAWLELTVLGVIGASRGLMTVTFLLIPISIGIVAFRSQARMSRIVFPLACASALLVAVLAGAVASGRMTDVGPYLFDRWEQALQRFAETSPDDLAFGRVANGAVDSAKQEFLEGSSRGGEFQDFISQMQPLDYVVGRGFGGTWSSSYWGQEWLIVHIGIGHLMLVGGVPLLLAFLWVLVKAGISAWLGLRDDPIIAGVFVYLLVFTQSFLQHGAIQDEIEVYFFWICVGLTVATSIARAQQKPTAMRRASASRLAS